MTSEYVVLVAPDPAPEYPALRDRKAGQGLISLTPHILRDNLQDQFLDSLSFLQRTHLTPYNGPPAVHQGLSPRPPFKRTAYCSRRWLSPHGLANMFGRSPVVNGALWLMRRHAAISFSLFIVSFIPSRISIYPLHTLVSIS